MAKYFRIFDLVSLLYIINKVVGFVNFRIFRDDDYISKI